MKKFYIFLLMFLWVFAWAHGFDIESIKNQSSYVIDQSKVLSPEEKSILEEKILSIKKSYTSEILLLITPTTSWEDIAALATKIWQELGVGKSDTDNGIVILIALQDRSWNIATWYGIEWVLPDLLVNKIWNKNFALFKEEKYFEWILWSLNDIDWVLAKDPTIISQLNKKEPNFEIFIFIFLGAFIISSIYLRILYKERKYKKIFSILFIWYILSLPIAFFVIWVIWFLINWFIWIVAWVFWIFWKEIHQASWGNFWGTWGGKWWFGGYGGWGFWWWGSSWKW